MRLVKSKERWIRWRGLAVRATFRALALEDREALGDLIAEVSAHEIAKTAGKRPQGLRPYPEVKAELRALTSNLCARYVSRLDACEAGELRVTEEAQGMIQAAWDRLASLREDGHDVGPIEALWAAYSRSAPLEDGSTDEDLEPLELDAGLAPDGSLLVVAWNDAGPAQREAICCEWPDLCQALVVFIGDRDDPELLKKSGRPRSLARARTPG